jgi:DNA recombination protein RmuC
MDWVGVLGIEGTGEAIFAALLIAVALAALALLFAILAWVAARRAARHPAPGRDDLADMLREESDIVRDAIEASARGLRQEIGASLAQHQTILHGAVRGLSDSLLQRTDAFVQRLGQMAATAETQHAQLRALTESRFDQFAAAEADTARTLREELGASFQRMKQAVGETLMQASNQQKERLEATQQELRSLAEVQKQSGEQLRQTVEGRLDLLRSENTAELEKVRATVDEKLQTTLEARLGESFNRVVEQLNRAYEVFGEMRRISANVGDLKNVLTNPKLRGTFGEVQLAMLLQDFLSPSQYIRDAQVREHSAERVEYAVRLPLHDGDEMLLPVDAKFPREDHEHMIAALEAGDTELAAHFRKALEARIKMFARDVGRKYINPPLTTERAIMFLPTESLFAEVLRMPGLFEHVQRECGVMLAGPTTFAAILHAFQVNHRSMAIAKQSSEVWKVLGAVRGEFRKYNETVAKVAKQLKTASGSVEELDRRVKIMDRALRRVETLPDEADGDKLLGLAPLASEAGFVSATTVISGEAVSADTEDHDNSDGLQAVG